MGAYKKTKPSCLIAQGKEIRKMVYSLVGEEVRTEGAKTNRTYYLITGRK